MFRGLDGGLRAIPFLLPQRPPVPTRLLSPPKPPPAELHHSHEVQGRSLHATQQELAAAAEQQGDLQAARARLDDELAGVQVRRRWQLQLPAGGLV